MRGLARRSPLEIWHSRIELAREIESHRASPRSGASCEASSPRRATTSRRTTTSPIWSTGQKQARIDDRPPLIYHFTAKGDARHHVDAKRAFGAYDSRLSPDRLCLLDRYALKDVAFKVVGVGSVGTFCAIGLYMCGDGTPLFLQIKEAGKSVLERLAPKFKGHQGQRVVEGQRVMQAASDVFPGLDGGRRITPSLLCAPSEEPAARFGRRAGRGASARELRAAVRAHARARPRALGGPGRARGLHGQARRPRRRVGVICDGLCGAHTRRLRTAREGARAASGWREAQDRLERYFCAAT